MVVLDLDLCLFYGCITLCVNPLNVELNPICHLLALLGTHTILHVSRIRVKTVIIIADANEF